MKMMFFFASVLGFVLALVPHLLWLVGWLVAKTWHHRLPYAPFGWAALALVLLSWGILGYGYLVGRWQQETRSFTFTHTDIPPAFDGYKIVHISDLHLGTFSHNPAQLQRIVDSINALAPDLICFTGDLVTLSTDEATPLIDILKGLHATDGIASVLGNHDFFIYGQRSEEQQLQERQRLIALERDTLGWTLLRNQHLTIHRQADSLTILGIDNANSAQQGFHTVNFGDLPAAMQGTGGCRILLSHDPSLWEADVLGTTDIQLTLSGHTHAAQLRLFGRTPASWMFRQSQGRYDSQGQTLYVNAGLGCTLPMRVSCPAEITLIELKTNKH